MLRSLWKGAISFGLVHIPCRLYPATVDREVHFRQLHSACGSAIRYRKFCPHCARLVEDSEIMRGVEVAPGSFVRVDDEDLPDGGPSEGHAVEILEFVDLAEVDPLLYERPYLVGPGEGGARPYALLRAALRASGRAAVARAVLRARARLALLRVVGDCLVLELLRYPDEVRNWSEVDGLPEQTAPAERELEVAMVLLERLAAPWQPDKYRDRYRDELRQRVVDKAADGAAATVPAGPGAPQGYADLLAALEASLAGAPGKRGRDTP